MTWYSGSFKRARPLLGTLVEIAVYDVSEDHAHEAIDRAFDTVESIQKKMSFHDPESQLSLINATAAHKPVQVDQETFEVLEIAQELYHATHGIFDVTIASELMRHEFLPSTLPFVKERLGSFSDITLNPQQTVRFLKSDIQIDLGGIAKGYAVQKAVERLKGCQIPGGTINAGGDLHTFGPKPASIAIRNPQEPGTPLTTFMIRNCSVATSAHYFAERWVPGSATGPFVDPNRNQLVNNVTSATVLARSAVYADALTKLVMIQPNSAWPILQTYHAGALIVDPMGATLTTPNWNTLLANET